MKESNKKSVYLLTPGRSHRSDLHCADPHLCANQLWPGSVPDLRGALRPSVFHTGSDSRSVYRLPAVQSSGRSHDHGCDLRKPGNTDRSCGLLCPQKKQIPGSSASDYLQRCDRSVGSALRLRQYRSDPGSHGDCWNRGDSGSGSAGKHPDPRTGAIQAYDFRRRENCLIDKARIAIEER